MGKNKMSAIKSYLIGKGANEELLQMMTQNVSKGAVQSHPQNRGQVAAQEQFRIIREALGISNA